MSLKKHSDPDGAPTVIVIGNPIDGLTLYGPFDDHDAAIDAGDRLGDAVWCVATLFAPEVLSA